MFRLFESHHDFDYLKIVVNSKFRNLRQSRPGNVSVLDNRIFWLSFRMAQQARKATVFGCGAFLLGLLCTPRAMPQEIRPGVWASYELQTLPLPTRGYQAYLVGELHGIAENEEFDLQYLTQLHKTSHLHDVAIEEKAVYEDQAQAYVNGRSETLPEALCLRAGVLGGIRLLNAGLRKDERIRIHLTDIDSPATAIRQHLVALKKRITKAANVSIPEASEVKERGLETVGQLKQYRIDSRTRSELRTVEHSIRAYQQGFEVDIGPLKGSPYLEDREQAVADNIADLVKTRSLLVLYGSDHVSKSKRKDGGPERDQPFSPMALRLEESGIRIFCLVTFPLAGRSFWRGNENELPFTAQDGHLASGETLDKVLATVPQARFIYVDTKRERVRLPSQDVSNFAVDAFLLFPSATPMKNHCALP
jgi:hypothetical protein